jgi:hypothetical protein
MYRRIVYAEDMLGSSQVGKRDGRPSRDGAFWGELQVPESLRAGLEQLNMIEEALGGVM